MGQDGRIAQDQIQDKADHDCQGARKKKPETAHLPFLLKAEGHRPYSGGNCNTLIHRLGYNYTIFFGSLAFF
jgi:hypothetical protein